MALDTFPNVVRITKKRRTWEVVRPMELSVCSPTSQSTESSHHVSLQDLPQNPREIQVSVQDGEVECSRIATLVSHSVSSCSSADHMAGDATSTSRRQILSWRPASTLLASWIARYPWIFLTSSLVLSIGSSIAGYCLVGFSVSAELDGWLSRGTLIANQNTQITLINQNTLDLFQGGESAWRELTSNVQAGFTANNPRHDGRRSLSTANGNAARVMSTMFDLPSCDMDYYTQGKFLDHPQNLWPLWETIDPSDSILDPPVFHDLCVAEQRTQDALHAAGLCGGCASGGCLPPISFVSFARMLVGDRDGSMDCAMLSEVWTATLPTVKSRLPTVVSNMRSNIRNEPKVVDFSDPYDVVALLLDKGYGIDGNENIRYTSSIFATAYSGKPVNELFALRDKLDRAVFSSYIKGAFDTGGEDFNKLAIDPLLISDMRLVVVSLVVTILAILIHTGSVWLTTVGLFQIALSFPMAYLFYTVVLGFDFFPFLNFIGIFVVFAIGADDIFVAADKWKNARIEAPDATTTEVAAVALPSAAKGMFLTTVTTAIAFFAAGICAVPAMKLFAIFSGLLIVFDYILCLLLILPALCIFDKWQYGEHVRCTWTRRLPFSRKSYTRRCLLTYYSFVHRRRSFCLAAIGALMIGSSLVARQLSLPKNSDVRVLRPENEFEKNHRWRQELLSTELERERGTRVWFMWGLTPADTGNRKNPRESSAIVLDESFDPSPVESQLYLRDFCDDLRIQEFAGETTDIADCPVQYFNSWLGQQALATHPHPLYIRHCRNATQLPLSPENLHPCMIGFAQAEKYTRILFNNGRVKAIRLPFRQVGASWDAGHARLAQSWRQLEYFTNSRNELIAPPGVDRVFGSSRDFWWYDTNASILDTAIGSLGVVLGAVYVTVLLSNMSFLVTFAATVSICFILLSSTAVLVLSGWTYGFLEAVCFAILVGTSCDFVLHFGYAYCSLPGHVDRHQRTKHALLTMGPSILAAAATTIAASIALLFASIKFFFMFGFVLLCSLAMGIFGSLVVFLVLLDFLGPSKTIGFPAIATRRRNEGESSKLGKGKRVSKLPQE